MTRPATRVLALLELLQSRGLCNGRELAERLAVHPRTLRRYIAALEELGVPVVAERGRDGGYRLLQGYKLPPMMFSNDEALALTVGLVAGRDLGIDSGSAASALAKLERVMPRALQERVRALGDSLVLDLVRAHAPARSEVLSNLGSAIRRQQTLDLCYRAATGADSERPVDPYAMALHGGRWYLLGYCHVREALRSFRIDRIVKVDPLPRSFAKPAEFDAAAYLRRAIAVLPRRHAIRVRLHTDLTRAREALFASLGVLEACGSGCLLHAQADDLDWMARELARLPFAFEVESPAALQDALRNHAAALLAMAGGRPLHP